MSSIGLIEQKKLMRWEITVLRNESHPGYGGQWERGREEAKEGGVGDVPAECIRPVPTAYYNV